jgi:hypothetical protein
VETRFWPLSRLLLAEAASRASILVPVLLLVTLPVPRIAIAEVLAGACPGRRSTPGSPDELVVVLQLPEGLSCALTAALEPWGLEVRSSNESLGPSMPSTSLGARRISQAYGARLVVWVAEDSEGSALWVYDAQQDRAVARSVPPPPYDDAIAAALALSVKTVVRMVGVGPEASPDAATRPAVEEPAVPEVPAPAPDNPPADELPSLSEEQHAPSLFLSGYGGLRSAGGDGLPWRYGGGLRWAPWGAWSGPRSWIWAGISAESGVSRSVDSAAFNGELSDYAGEFSVGFARSVTSRLALGGVVSAGVSVASLSGSVRSADSSFSTERTRLNPAVMLAAEVQFRAGPIAFFLQPAGGTWLKQQRYVASNDTVLYTPQLTGRLAAGLLVDMK